MPPRNTAHPTPVQREAAGRLLREARRRRELTLIEVARRAHYSNHQVVHHWESNGPPWRDRAKLLWIVAAYRLYQSEAAHLLALCRQLDPLSNREWQEYGDPPEGVQPVPSSWDTNRDAPESLQGLTLDRPEGVIALAERRQVTVLRCYVFGFSDLADCLSRHGLQDVVDVFHETCVEVISHMGGHILEALSDRLIICFGYPMAHEDDARRAMRTGLTLIESVDLLNQQIEARHGVRLTVGITGHTTHGILPEGADAGTADGLVLGESVDTIVALGPYALAGSLVISEASYRLVEGFFSCQALGTASPLGQSGLLQGGVYQVLHESGARGRVAAAAVSGNLSPLVGRELEVQALLNSWRRVQQGYGQTVLLRGSPGIGKSRLVQVLKENLVAEPPVVLEGQCLELYQQSPLYPIVEILEGLFGLTKEQNPDEKLEHLVKALASFNSPALEEAALLLASLLSLPLPGNDRQLMLTSSRLRQKTLEAVVHVLLQLAEQGPVLFILEDLHWADASTLDLLELLVEHTSSVPLMALLTLRPELQPPSWVFRDHVSGIYVERLPRDDEELLIGHLLRGESLPPEAHQELLAKTEGVPLYIEELVRLVIESNQAVIHNNSNESAGSPKIPSALEGGLTARLDHLPEARGWLR